jgi:hypothetical protein
MSRNSVFSVRPRYFSFFLLALTVILTMVACSSSKTPTEDSSVKSGPPAAPHYKVKPDEKVLGSVDVLTATPGSQSEPTRILAEGWAASADAASPITVVALLIDGKVAAETTALTPRPDVAAAYDRSDFEKCAYKFEVPVKKLGAGEHPVTVRATNAHGDQLVLPGKTLVLQ